MFDSAKKFIEAAKDGDYATVDRYLRKYFYHSRKLDLDTRDAAGITALSHAVRKGHTDILKRMLDFGLDSSIADNEGFTPLMIALTLKQRAAAVLLAERGADVNTHTGNYITPLHVAAYGGDIDMVKTLHKHGAKLDAVITENGYTALHWAIAQGHANIVEYLVQQGVRTDMPDKKGQTQAEMAAKKGAHMQKILETPPPPTPAPAPVEEEPEAPAPAYAGNDRWLRTGEHHVTHIGEIPEINRKLTEIFNFETRERTVISENTRSGAENAAAPESFDNVAEAALRKALGEFKKLGGAADENDVIGTRNKGPATAGGKPFRV